MLEYPMQYIHIQEFVIIHQTEERERERERERVCVRERVCSVLIPKNGNWKNWFYGHPDHFSYSHVACL